MEVLPVTVLLPKRNILDRVLSWFGKERDIVVPKNVSEIHAKFGPHVIIKAKWGSFWKALMSCKTSKPKER